MIRRPPRTTRTDTLFPYTTLFRSLKTDEWRVKGCINRAWLHGEARDGRVYFQASSESEIVAGLIALLIKVYSGRTPREIVDNPPALLHRIGVWENITRSEESTVGKECASPSRSGCTPYHEKKKRK